MDKAQRMIDTDLDTISVSARPGFYAAKYAAQEEMVQLKEQFASECSKHWGGIFVGGSNDEEYIELAQKEGDLIVVNAAALYQSIAVEVEKLMGDTRVFGPSQMAILLGEVRNVAINLDIKMLNKIPYQGDEALASLDLVMNHVRKVIRDALGDELNILYLRNKIAEEAFSKRYVSSIVPVAVIGVGSAEEQAGLAAMFKEHISIRPTKKMSSSYVIDTFKRLQKQFLDSRNP
jgi:hypothetical protein